MTTDSDQTINATKESILFVDDEPHILTSLRRLMRPLKLNLYFAESGDEGLKILEENTIDLIVSDMRMPKMDGAEFLAKAKEMQPDSVRILLTGYADISSTIDALNNGGIYRYISKPWDDDELKSIVYDSLKIKRLEREQIELTELTQRQNDQLQDLNDNLEAKVEARTQEITQTSQMLDIAYQELKSSYDSFVLVFSNIINARKSLQKAESRLVAELSRKMAIALKLKPDNVQNIYYAALLHQVGKMSLPDKLLTQSEDQMNESDLATYQQYSHVGETSLATIKGFEKTALLIRNHTEYFDGSGFPDGLIGNKARSGARIIRTVRDYLGLQTGIMSEKKYTAGEAFQFIKKLSNKKYDPIIVKCLDYYRGEYDLSSLYGDEMEVGSRSLLSGMMLTRDLVNSRGLLLMSKGHVFNDPIITKIIAMEELEEATFKFFIAKDQNKTDTPSKGP